MQGDAEYVFARFQRTGDPEALGQVVDAVGSELLQVALHLARGPAEAEDLLQETLLVAMERAASWDSSRPLRPWLVGILANRARLARQDATRRPDPERLARDAARGPHERAVELELTDEIEAALLKVPAVFQPVLVLRLKHHLSVPEIANALRRPPGTVRSQLQRGLERLRRLLPASYAGAFALLLGRPTRGLSAIREALVAEAPAATAVGLTASSLTGIFAMKHVLVTTVLALCAGAGYTLLEGGREGDPEVALPESEPAGVERDELAVPSILVARAPLGEPTPKARDEAAATAAAATPMDGEGALLIRVLDETSGEPAVGYLVQVEAFGERPVYHDPFTAVTGANGEALFEGVPAGHTYTRLLRGSEGGATVVAGETTLLSLRAWAGVTVHGRVVDAEGNPVAGADLWVSERWRSNTGYSIGKADVDGCFTIASLTSDHFVGAAARGYASSLLQPVRGEPGAEYELTLTLDRPGGGVTGVVFDPLGSPVAGALVLVGPQEPSRRVRMADGGHAVGPPLRRVHTDETGAFRVRAVHVGSVPILVRAAGFAPYASEMLVRGGGESPLAIVLTPETRVTGRVIDEAGTPVASVWVHTDPPGRYEGTQDYTDLEGRFQLRGLGAGPVRLVAAHKNAGEAAIELDLSQGAEYRWEPVLAAVRRFHGVVLDHTGMPLEGWTVVAQPEGQNEVRLRSFPTDPAGRFTVTDVDDVPHKLWAQEPNGWQRFPRLVLRDVWPRSEVTLQLEDPVLTTGTVVGEVVSASGGAPAAARLSFWHEDLRLWREYAVDSKTGAIRVEGVPPGTCWLELRSRMHPWKRLGSFEVEAGEAVDLGRQVLPLGGVLAGEIASCPEDALETLRFLLIDEEGREGGVMQRTGTSFRSSPLAPGEYVLEVRGDYVAGARERFVVASGEQTALTLRLEHAPLRRVVIECAAGAEPLRHVWCEVHEGAGARVWMNGNLRRLEDGRFVARVSLPAGSYRLVAGAEDGRTLEAALVLTDAEGQEPLRLML